jgi:hypothetical protein
LRIPVLSRAPDFYARSGYVEFARTEGVPTVGRADVHMVKAIQALDRSPRLA